MSSLADLPELVGFFSYSREDDADSHGALSGLRSRIQGELRGQLGRTAKNFRLWQDKEAIPSGTLWESEIKNSVAQSVFFIPIITPTVVASPNCRFELQSFLAREAELGRSDLLFPILYIRVPSLEDSARQQSDPIISTIAKRQYVDWREFRHLDVNSTEVKKAVELFCADICDALRRSWLSPEERKQQEEAAELRRVEAEAKRRAEEGALRRAAEQEQLEREAEAEQQRRMARAQAERPQEDEQGRDTRLMREAGELAEQERRTRDEETKRRAEAERAFAKAKRADAVAAVDLFLATYSTSRLAAEAKRLRTSLAERDEAYKTTMASTDPAALESFLERYPEGRPADQVRKRLRRVGPAVPGQGSRRRLFQRASLVAGAVLVAIVCGILGLNAYREYSLREWQKANGPDRTILDAQLRQLNSVSFSPDGRRIVTASSGLLANCKGPAVNSCDKLSPDHGVRVWDFSSGAVLMNLTGSEDDWRAIFSPDGQEIAWEGPDGIKIADASTGQLIRGIAGARGLLSFSADSRLLLSQTQIWNAATGRLVKSLSENCTPVAAYAPGAKHAVTSKDTILVNGHEYNHSGDQAICDTQTGKVVLTLSSSSESTDTSYFPDGKRIAGVDDDLYVWDAESGARIEQFDNERFEHLSVSADGKLVAGTTIFSDAILILDTASWGLVHKFYCPDGSETSTIFSPDARELVGFSPTQQKIEIWNMPTTAP